MSSSPLYALSPLRRFLKRKCGKLTRLLEARLSEGSNGNNAVRVPVESVDLTITIHHNVISGQFEVEGWQVNRLVSIGMLEYALVMIKRADAQAEMLRQMQNAPRIVPP